MSGTVTQKLVAEHLLSGAMRPGEEIGLRIDQTLTQDATGTLVMLELEAMGIERVATELSVQYVDHNLIQEDHKNPDDHLFLQSACKRFGIHYSRPGNGVSHPVHQERFGVPGKSLLGSDSHTPAAGALGMLAIGAGGLEVALTMAGEPFYLKMPEVWGVRLVGELPEWVSAKDVILEMLRRHSGDCGVGRVIEYHGQGLASLSAMDRHVIANMGTELGATTTVFPSDGEVRRFLAAQGRESCWKEIVAEPDAAYDVEEEIDLSRLEPLIAMPSSPGRVRAVAEVEGERVYQAYVGSSANPGFRDFAIAAEMLRDRRVDPGVSFDVNPSTRQVLLNLMKEGHLASLVIAGARIHQAGCNGCIGMGQAPATDRISLRTVPRNFPGRSGTREDRVCLVSPETATAAAITGRITDPRKLGQAHPEVAEPEAMSLLPELIAPPSEEDIGRTPLEKGPNIKALPDLDGLPERLEIPVLLTLGDDVSTDEIMPAGAEVLPYRSNIEKIAEFCFAQFDETYPGRAESFRGADGHGIVAGANYGQGSSREHAALAPRSLGLRLVIAESFARIHWQNLCNFGVLPLTFVNPEDREWIELNDVLEFEHLRQQVREERGVRATSQREGRTLQLEHSLTRRQVDMVLAGGALNIVTAALVG